MMTPAAKMSSEIASQSVTTQVPFTRSMQKMLGDRLHNVPKSCQFRSPFQIIGMRPRIPSTKALTLMKKIRKDAMLNRYNYNGIMSSSFYL
jgi:hypothetical protein